MPCTTSSTPPSTAKCGRRAALVQRAAACCDRGMVTHTPGRTLTPSLSTSGPRCALRAGSGAPPGCRRGARPQVWFGSRVVVLVADPELGRLVSRNPNRHAYPHLGDLKSAADNASFFSSITTARECAPAARRPPAAGCAGG